MKLETIQKCKQVHAKVKAGMTHEKALKEIGMSTNTYAEWRKTRKRLAKGKTKQTLFEIPAETPFTGGKIFALVGAPREVIEAIKGMI